MQDTHSTDVTESSVKNEKPDPPVGGEPTVAWFENEPTMSPVLKQWLRAGKAFYESDARNCVCSRCPGASFIELSFEQGIVCHCEYFFHTTATFRATKNWPRSLPDSAYWNPVECDGRSRYEKRLKKRESAC